ncbi:MAG: hypothetical protein J1E64_13130 [Acetatifactor sp.]|nr:hypothetical protein [Acetatifactor sp.]
MTVEAAVVLPLFVFFFINLGCAIEMIRLHGNLQLALRETGNRLSVYGHALGSGNEEGGNGFLQEVSDIAFSYTYVKRQIVDYAGEEYLNQSPLSYGTDGLQFVESELFTSEDTFEIVLTYAVSPWLQVPVVRPFRMVNKYYGHIWNGYQLPETSFGGEEQADFVYVAQNGTVYHDDRNCSHLSLAIRQVGAGQVEQERNANGGRYTACEKCAKGLMPHAVYIGEEGDRYHYDRDCSGLKRTVFTMTRQKAKEQYRPCSRCAK